MGVNLRKWGVRAVEIQAGFFGKFKFKFKFKLALKKPGSGYAARSAVAERPVPDGRRTRAPSAAWAAPPPFTSTINNHNSPIANQSVFRI